MTALRWAGPPSPPPVRTMLVAAVTAGLLASAFVVGPVAAATDQLRLAVAATYRVDTAKRAVRVVLDITATNEKPDTSTTYYWYDTATFVIPEDARSVRATSNGSPLDVTTDAPRRGPRRRDPFSEPLPRQDPDDASDVRSAERRAAIGQPHPCRSGTHRVRRLGLGRSWPRRRADRPAAEVHRRRRDGPGRCRGTTRLLVRGRADGLHRQAPGEPDRLVLAGRGIQPRCPDRCVDRGRWRACRHPRLAGGQGVAGARLDGPRGQPARPRGRRSACRGR